MQARSYIGVFAIVLGSLMAGWLGLVYAITGAPTVSSKPLCTILAEKRRIAKAMESAGANRRLFLVSGSSTHFGISAADIEAALQIPTVNFGSHAAMPMTVILGYVKRLVRPGDAVLLAPEYERYSGRGLNDVVIDYLVACDDETLRALPWLQQMEAAFGLGTSRAMAGVASRVGLDDVAERLAYWNLPLPLGERYSDETHIGPRGDAIVNERSAITARNRRRIAAAPPPPRVFEAASDDVQAMISFVRWARQNDVRILATWPNMIRFAAYQSPAAHAFFRRIRAFYDALGVPVLGAPEAVMFDIDAFFDHHYHLHRDAVARRTARLIPLLRDAISAPDRSPASASPRR